MQYTGDQGGPQSLRDVGISSRDGNACHDARAVAFHSTYGALVTCVDNS